MTGSSPLRYLCLDLRIVWTYVHTPDADLHLHDESEGITCPLAIEGDHRFELITGCRGDVAINGSYSPCPRISPSSSLP